MVRSPIISLESSTLVIGAAALALIWAIFSLQPGPEKAREEDNSPSKHAEMSVLWVFIVLLSERRSDLSRKDRNQCLMGETMSKD